MKILQAFLRGMGAFFTGRVGQWVISSVLFTVLAAVAVQYKDKIPLLMTICNSYEVCKIKVDDMVVNMQAVPVITSKPVVMDTDEETGEISVKVAVPINTSATTADGQ